MTQALEKTAFQQFQVRPQLLAKGKTNARLVNTDILSVSVQVVASGGETNLHAHRADDACWLVLSGRVRFYTTGDEVVAEFGRNEGLIIPRGTPYWFESASDENLVIMRIGAKAQTEEKGRIDYTERKFMVKHENGVDQSQRDVEKLDAFFGQ